MRALSVIPLALLACACGFRVDDPELEEAANWHGQFRRENPEWARQLAKECGQEISPGWNRDDAIKVINCIRAKAGTEG